MAFHTFIPSNRRTPINRFPMTSIAVSARLYAQLGGLIGSSSISFASVESFETPHFNEPASYTSTTFVVFAARAPPYSA